MMKILLSKDDNIRILYRVILITLLIFTFLECIFFPAWENLYGCAIFFIGWQILYQLVLKTNRTKCLFPYLALLGLGISFFWLPLLATFLEGKPVTFRFQNPYLTFSNQLLNLVMLICAYRLCYRIYRQRNPISKLWNWMGYFKAPTDLQVWILGFIGIASYIALLQIQGTDAAEAENLGLGGQLLFVLRGFSVFPALLLFKRLYTGQDYQQNHNLVFFYLGLLVLIGIGTGKRTLIFGPFVAMFMCYLIPAIVNNKKLFTTRNSILIIALVYLVTGPAADLAMAMAMGRDNSSQTSSSRTFSNITQLYGDREQLHNMYQMYMSNIDNGGDNDFGWSEYYVDNIMLDRFCNLRVCDASLYYARKLGYDNPRMQDYLYKQIIYLLPTPILNVFGYHFNKFEYGYTPGDLLSTEGLGLKYQYKGYRVAGDTGVGLYLWGYMYYFYAFFIYFALFYFMSTRVKTGTTLIIPLPELATFYTILFTFNNATGIVGVIGTLLRTGWQSIVVYCIIFSIIRKITFK